MRLRQRLAHGIGARERLGLSQRERH
jgi:hypothetical protein